MKSRILKALLVAFLAIGLFACHGQDSNEGSGTGTGASPPDSSGSGGSGSGGSGSGGSGNPSPGPTTPSTPATPVTPGGPTSEALISQALASGQITAETALKYRVLAAFGDPRLPATFKGNDGGTFETAAISEAAAQFDSLSSDTQQVLAPYMLRPSNAGSWMDPSVASKLIPLKSTVEREGLTQKVFFRPICNGESSDWKIVNGASARVNVWYRPAISGQREKAQVVSDAIENKIWPALINTPGGVGFMAPLDDSKIVGCDGGDPRLDVYLVSDSTMLDRADTIPEVGATNQSPVFIVLNTDKLASDDELRGGTAHEFMHAIQYAYKMKSFQTSYGWMRDAMANWAIDQVYGKSKVQVEQDYADCFTSKPYYPLDDMSKGNCSKQSSNVGREYGAYLFFQFIAHTAGADKVKLALENTVTEASSLEAVDKAVPGGFKNQWWQFAKTLWNQAPIDTRPNSFKQWDDLDVKPKQRDLIGDLIGFPDAIDHLDANALNLSVNYYHFTFSDPNTRSVLFYNGFFDQIQAGKAISILALWKDEAGNWQDEDWSNVPGKAPNYKFVGLCRDIKIQRATELTIIVANGEKDPGGSITASNAPYLKRNNIGCYKYEGQVTMDEKQSGWGGTGRQASLNLALGFFNPTLLQTLAGTNPSIPNSLRAGMNMIMNNIGTAYSFQENYSDSLTSGACTFTFGPVTYPLAWQIGGTGTAYGTMMLNTFKELQGDSTVQSILNMSDRGYLATLVDSRIIDVTVTGRGCVSPKQDSPGMLFLTGQDLKSTPVVKDDGTMSGSYKASGVTWEWTLSPKSEP